MEVYWIFYIIGLICFIIDYNATEGTEQCALRYKQFEKRFSAFLFLVVGIFVMFRDEVLDTYMYVSVFKSIPTSLEYVSLYLQNSHFEFGFITAQFLFKRFITTDHYYWFGFVAAVSLIPLFQRLKCWSDQLGFSSFLFIAGTSFTWLINGMRQYIVVCLLFYFSFWLLKGGRIRFIITIILLSLIHKSVLILLPIYLIISTKKIFNWSLLFIILLTIIGIIYSDIVLDAAMIALEMDYSHTLENGQGASFIRFLVVAVPSILIIFNIRKIREMAPRHIVLAANLSVVGACFMLAAVFTNGILIGRLPAYFNMYNLYLLPWLIKVCFPTTHKIVVWLCVILYSVFFYFQMCVAWHGLPYISHFFNLYLT